ncbi:MAG: VOC family protein [Culicoidibacterales bacterium]
MVKVAQIMLYVTNQEKCAQFWTELLGFVEVGRQDYGESFAIELEDQTRTGTKLVLQNKAVVAKKQPQLNLAVPSILLTVADVDKLYDKLKQHNITVGEKVIFPNTNKGVFNFADPEGNYFAAIDE